MGDGASEFRVAEQRDMAKVPRDDVPFRDLCALVAMHAFLGKFLVGSTFENIAVDAYGMADAMISERRE